MGVSDGREDMGGDRESHGFPTHLSGPQAWAKFFRHKRGQADAIRPGTRGEKGEIPCDPSYILTFSDSSARASSISRSFWRWELNCE
jgi:hypothetical protein